MNDINSHNRAQPLRCIKGCDARNQDPICVVAAYAAIVEITGAGCIILSYSFKRQLQQQQLPLQQQQQKQHRQ